MGDEEARLAQSEKWRRCWLWTVGQHIIVNTLPPSLSIQVCAFCTSLSPSTSPITLILTGKMALLTVELYE